MSDFLYCDLSKEAKDKIRSQIDSGSWKHSWHLPTNANGYVEWNSIETITKIRDVLVDQITDAKEQLRNAETCLTMTVNAMIKMEQETT